MRTATTCQLAARLALGALLGVTSVGCAPRAPAPPKRAEVRPVAPPVRDALDPLGFVLEHTETLALTPDQRDTIRDLRIAVRRSNGGDLAWLDSLDAALGGRLEAWLREARGGARPRPRWLPKLPPAQRDTFERVVRRIRTRYEAAECRVNAMLTTEQRASLRKLDAVAHRDPWARRAPEGRPADTDPMPALALRDSTGAPIPPCQVHPPGG